ncbi:uncharacterized protein LOC115034128 [Acyrthosiphon pisum]|uniref:Nanos-type domain-containing protein n=1 Tax=Acyrthosiphon pisum TaxID=7029 RepID=A0A8R2JT66_ACYPI|nr:uncharacterized protein LOC115034128 [Acyrthosiphon pisum]
MAFYYSKRFPNMCMSSTFYDDIMKTTEMHVNYYKSRWFDFGELYLEPSFNEAPVPWTNRSVLQPIESPIKSAEANNNKIHVIKNDDTKSGSIDSDSSRSETSIDEKTASYAKIIKYSKPTKSKQYEKLDYNIIEKSRKESIKSNRILLSKKISIKLPIAPFLPNNQHCAFCKNNGEEEFVYRTHFLKDELGNVKCPILSRYTCPYCSATGNKAHTISRCPFSIRHILVLSL